MDLELKWFHFKEFKTLESTVDPQTVNEVVEDANPLRSQKPPPGANRFWPWFPSHGLTFKIEPFTVRQNCNVDHWRKSTSKLNCARPSLVCCSRPAALFQDPEQQLNMFEWKWNFGKGLINWLRSQSVTEEEMALMNLIIFVQDAILQEGLERRREW